MIEYSQGVITLRVPVWRMVVFNRSKRTATCTAPPLSYKGPTDVYDSTFPGLLH